MTACEYLRLFLSGPQFYNDLDAAAAFAAVEHIEQRITAVIEAMEPGSASDDLWGRQWDAVVALGNVLPPKKEGV
jgi:hypothetical protein